MSDVMIKNTPYDSLILSISEYLYSKGFLETNIEEYLKDIPKKWEKFSDVLILPNSSFRNIRWNNYRKDLWKIISEVLLVNRIGIMGEINGEKRESSVELVLGNDDWVIRKENGIKYGYRFTKCMFSSGNINERRRMGEVGKDGEIVIDLYAGIGYYSIPMLVFSKIKHIHSCEWNPESVRALNINLDANDVKERCTIHFGDNKITTNNLKGIADRVILGLLPSANDGYISALNVLKENGFLHIHGIAPSKDYGQWINETIKELLEIRPKSKIFEVNRSKIKSYAPHWDHIVLDIKVE
ncbi:MAG: tRNA wybutosine-synthesizing protein 3 [Candidatus Thalassarchaeaceae archaeon]|jgi:tRNA wybutosine-synthesizing protein 3